jgi:hypothetical protein
LQQAAAALPAFSLFFTAAAAAVHIGEIISGCKLDP